MHGKNRFASECFPGGLVVWAKEEQRSWWPCLVLNMADVEGELGSNGGLSPVTRNKRMIRRFNDNNKIAVVHNSCLKEYTDHIDFVHEATEEDLKRVIGACLEANEHIKIYGNEDQMHMFAKMNDFKDVLNSSSPRKRKEGPRDDGGFIMKPQGLSKKQRKRRGKAQNRKKHFELSHATPEIQEKKANAPDGNEDNFGTFVFAERKHISSECMASPDLQCISKNVIHSGDVSEIKVGSQISLLWKNELTWYKAGVAKVTFNENTGSCEVMLYYKNGTMHSIDNLMNHRWRLLPAVDDAFPVVSYDLDVRSAKLFSNCMAKAKRTAGNVITVAGDYPVFRVDYLSLEGFNWLTDDLIYTFGKVLLRKASITCINRVLLMDPSLSQPVQFGHFEHFQMADNLEMHDVDYILWPVLDMYRKHWVFCVAATATRAVYMFDPRSPKQYPEIGMQLGQRILQAFRFLSMNYDAKYHVEQEWKLEGTSRLASELNLPYQPLNNGTDCGVIVCYYMWAFIVFKECPTCFEEFSSLMKKCRAIIGGHLAKPIYNSKK